MSEQRERDSIEDKLITLPAEWSIAISGYEDDKQGEDVAEMINTLLRLLASHGSDLRSLDGVTLAVDCKAAAAQLQKWPDGKGPLYRAERGHVVEMARTVAVWRGAELRFHIILQAAVGLMMLSEEEEDYKLALSCLAHEAAHVEHEGNLFRNCPHIFGGPLKCGERSSRLFLTAMDTWSEYAACRSSAFFRPEGAKEFDELFYKAMQDAVAMTNGLEEVVEAPMDVADGTDRGQQLLSGLFIYAGYLFGHFDGLPFHLERKELRAMEELQDRSKIHALFLRLHEALRYLWLTECSWTGLDVFVPLYDLLEELIAMDIACWRSPRPFLVRTPS